MSHRHLTEQRSSGNGSVPGPEAALATVTAEVTHGGAESWGLFRLHAGPKRERSPWTTLDDCPSPVMRFAAEPSEVRVWPRCDGIVLAGRLRTRIRTVFGIVPGHRHDERVRSGRYLSERCWIDAGSMLDRYWRSERCGRSLAVAKAGSAAYISSESATPPQALLRLDLARRQPGPNAESDQVSR
jgi:hypothetical protein